MEENKENKQTKNRDDNNITTLTPMDLNKIKLDPKHTILTAEYLENLLKKPSFPSVEDKKD